MINSETALIQIRDEIRRAMDAANVSEAALSQQALIPRSTLARKLAGVSEFTLSELLRIAPVLSCTPAEIVAAGTAA